MGQGDQSIDVRSIWLSFASKCKLKRAPQKKVADFKMA